MSYIDDFKTKARKWASDVVALKNTPAKGELLAEKNRLLNFANKIRLGVDSIFKALESVGLGIAPLIPLAIVGASLTAMSKWYSDYKILMTKLAEQQRLEKMGVDPKTASEIISSTASKPSLFSDARKMLPWLAMAGAVLLFYKRL